MSTLKNKSKSELIEEIELLKKRVRDFERIGNERKQAEKALLESEERFRSLFENAPLSYQSLNEQGDIIEVNETWCNVLGYTKQEVLSKNFSEFVHPDFQESFKENFPKFRRVGYILGVEFEMIKKDGTEIIVSFDGKIGHNEDGSFQQTHCVLKDITQSKQAEEALRQYEHIVSSSTDMLSLLDKQFKYLAANDAYIEAFNLIPEELIGNTVADVFGEEFFNAVIKPNADRCMLGEEVNFQDWFDFPAYKQRYMDITYFPHYGEDNNVEGFVVNGRDITERKKTEKALKESEDRLIKMSEATFEGIVLSEEGKLIEANQQFADMFGYKLSEARGLTVANLVAPEHLELVSGHIKEEYSEAYECNLLRKDGSIFYAEVRGKQVFYKDRIVRETVLRDITEHKQAEEKLKNRNRELQTFYDAAVGRELKVIELKKEINEMLEKAGAEPKYKLPV